MRKFLVIVLSIVVIFVFSACDKGATNNTNTGSETNYKTEKEHTHFYGKATCKKAATCICGATDGSPLDHNWEEATCIKPVTCSYCGAIDGSPLEHNWEEATCIKATTCSRCGSTSGVALGHSYSKGKCSLCNASDPDYFEPLVFSGSGNKIVTGVNLPEGLYKISLTYKGTSNFIVVPYDGDGDRKSSWANEIGTYNGSVIYSDSLKDGYIEVKSSGQWTITISKDFGVGTSNLAGTGDCVSPFFTLENGVQVVNLLNKGKSNFIVVLYDENGTRYSSLANEIGDYEGQTIFNRGKKGTRYCIAVTSGGTWSVNFGIDETITSVTTN